MARKKVPTKGKTARSRKKPSRKSPSVGRLDQKSLDLIGLGLTAVAVYLGFVIYGGWGGGRVGSSFVVGLETVFGLGAWLVPVALLAIALILMFDPDLPSARPIWPGAALLGCGLLVFLAAGTFGLLGQRSGDLAAFDLEWARGHGGMAGEGLFWAIAQLLQPVGAHILGLVAIFAGLLLVTGTTVSAVFSFLGNWMSGIGKSSAEVGRTILDSGVLDRTRTAGHRDGDLATELGDIESGEQTVKVAIWEEDLEGVDLETDSGPIFDPGEQATAEHPIDEECESEAVLIGGDLDKEDPAEDPVAPVPAVEVGEQAEMPLTPMGETRGATFASGRSYRVPAKKVLARGKGEAGPAPGEQKELARKLVETLGHFGVEAVVTGVVTGPHVSRFELRLAPGTKVKKVTELSNDLAYALASTDIRILAPIPGKQAVGVEVPNASRKMVRLGEIYSRPPEDSSPLVAWLGKGIDGKAVAADLATMPHILVAGTTGSGKSGCVNAILSSILMHSSPDDVRLVLVDPKQVELNHYETVPHLLTPVVTNPKLAANVLSNLIAEMETRYGLMKETRARNIADYNAGRRQEGLSTLPHILCVIDELADLMMVAPADVEASIIRLAQKSRATGIHLVLATQRPSTDIITGTIKVNIPSRIAFAVSSQTDSRVILDQGGAESLLGQGDMLFRAPGTSKIQRIQGAFISEDEIAKITGHWAGQGEPEFVQGLLEERSSAQDDRGDDEFDPDSDELLDEAIRLVVETETASVSMIQRRLRVGYTRAGRLIDMLERRGVISGYEGSKPRQVLVTSAELPSLLGGTDDVEGGDGELVIAVLDDDTEPPGASSA